MKEIFEHLFILGRPAGGKSEFLDMLHQLSDEQRVQRMHIGGMVVLDDFVWLWEKFEEDNLWEKIGRSRLHSKREGQGYILCDGVLFDFLIEKLNWEVKNKYLGNPGFYENGTLLIEFARGGEVPYQLALERFEEEVLKRAAILYVEVSHQESVRRNEARYREKLKSSILAHKTPDHDMKRFYSEDDWPEITESKREGHLEVKGIKVPFLTLLNEPEIKDPVGLADRYSPALNRLYSLSFAHPATYGT